jgi:hypothetical protein
MATLVKCFIRQDSGGHKDDFFGPLFFSSPYVQKENRIGRFLASPLRTVKPLAFRGARALGREALNTEAHSLAGIAFKPPETKFKDIVTYDLANLAQRLVDKIKVDGRRKIEDFQASFFGEREGK